MFLQIDVLLIITWQNNIFVGSFESSDKLYEYLTDA